MCEIIFSLRGYVKEQGYGGKTVSLPAMEG